MKKILLALLLLQSYLSVLAMHITGGEMFYTLVGQSGTDYTYQITLKLYRDCNASTPLDAAAPIAVFNNATNAMVWSQSVTKGRTDRLDLSSPSPCISPRPSVCYEVGYYTFTVTLPAATAGYTIAYQRCCRIGAIVNIANSANTGITYSATIPGTNSLANAPSNNSAKFIGIDTIAICRFSSFCYDFGAVDPDGDSLAYSFCNAYLGGGTSNGSGYNNNSPNPPAPPPYTSPTYNDPFSASQPLGSNVTINPRTGLMCGVAPHEGIYVVTVCVSEYRNGVLIAVQRKDIQINIGECTTVQATLKPQYITCDGFTYTFSNEASFNPLVNSYYWEFSDGFTSTQPNPTHTFADTGTYTFKLVLNRNGDCSDSTTSKIKVYPGFFPGFKYIGVCVNKPTQFIDTTSTRYGFVNTWRWDFGETAVTNDTSHLQNPTYSYPTAGTKTVTFVVSNSVGCVDTVVKDLEILTRPPLRVAFKDTLLCRGDSVQLHATGDGVFSWTPLSNILNDNTSDPTVFPPSTTGYVVKLDYQGCIAFDTVKVNVIPFVTVVAMPDTIICATDTLRLYATTDGLKYLWNNAFTLNDPTLLRPTAKPVTNPTVYTITSTVGRCSSKDSVKVTLVPYPVVNAGPDTTVCFSTSAQLHGTTDGSSFSWSPASTLTNETSLTPLARPKKTTDYILTAYDTRGCPKPGRDTVRVIVNPEVVAFAGRDTAVVVGQTLQFNAAGGVNYSWSPTTALNNPFIPNPKAVYDGSFDSIRYTVTVTDSIGCGDEATVLIKIFRTSPKIFVPTAFTPNGDGRNEFVAAIAVGITKLDYFRIFNRWGQLVFETTINGKGWDGRLGGVPQGSGTYVWIVRGMDYTGKVVFDKGTVTLIR